jgi:hypothetical protein
MALAVWQHARLLPPPLLHQVVEFDFLTPESVADYCHERGFLQCFWECGGTLAAPTIASGVVHKARADPHHPCPG